MSLRTLGYVIPVARLARRQPPSPLRPSKSQPTPPSGRSRPKEPSSSFDGESLAGWVSRDGKTPAAWPVADGVMTVGGATS